jgi:F-box interacting protein
MMGHGRKYVEGKEIPAEMLHEILLKLPTRDVVRCSLVSRLWRSAVKISSFRKLHDASHVAAAAPPEVLMVSEHRKRKGRCAEASVFNVSSGKPMCHIVNPPGYSLTNVCGGFLCFAPTEEDGEQPAVLCNPATGEKLKLPETPMRGWNDLVALGFSPSTSERKLFRYTETTTSGKKYLDVYTLGESSGWRRHTYIPQHGPRRGSHQPVLVGGKLYVMIDRPDGYRRKPDRILVIDVASEMHCTYRLPRFEAGVQVNAFELRGQLCLAVSDGGWCKHHKVQFWVMPPLDRLVYSEDEGTELKWDLRYSFYIEGDFKRNFPFIRFSDPPRGVWLDDKEMLCYRLGNTLYKYDTNADSLSPNSEPLQWNQKLVLPPIPQRLDHQWGIYPGYRPTLLSPLTFLSPPSKEEEEIQQFEHALLETLRTHISQNVGSAADERAAKRICGRINSSDVSLFPDTFKFR